MTLSGLSIVLTKMFFERDLEGLRGRESEQITKRCSAGAAPGSEQCDLFREFLGDVTAALHKSWRERERGDAV